MLNLTEVDRVRLKINTIGTVDMTPEERKRKLRDRDRKRTARRANGLISRDQYLAANRRIKADGRDKSVAA